MQALGGLTEVGAGGWATFGSGGLAAPVGFPVLAHGLDQFMTGMGTTITGRYRPTVTEQLLYKTGIPSQTAGMINDGLSIFGTIGAAAVVRASQLAAFPQLSSHLQSTKTQLSNLNALENKIGASNFNFSDAASKHMHKTGRRIPIHVLDDVIRTPIKIVKDPQGTSNAMMYYSRLWRNGRPYNVEVL